MKVADGDRPVRARTNLARDALLVGLSAASGGLDAIAYLRFHTFTANMTGNTVLLGLAAGGRHLGDVAHAGIAVASFVAGAFLGSALGAKARDDDPWPLGLWRPFGVEVAALASLAFGFDALAKQPSSTPAMLLLGAGAMGLQSAITSDVRPGGVSTTYMSGTVARIGELLAETLRMGLRGGLVLSGLSWLVYLVSAFAVGALDVAGVDVAIVLWVVSGIVLAVALLGRAVVVPAR